MRDEDRTKEELIGELEKLRRRVADLEKMDADLKKIETDLLGKNHECQMLTSELDKKYQTIRWHETMLNQGVEELKEKNMRLDESNRQLRRKRITIRVLVVLFAIFLVTLGAAVYLGKVGQSVKSLYQYEDASHRPMGLERAWIPNPTKTGMAPTKDVEKKDLPGGK